MTSERSLFSGYNDFSCLEEISAIVSAESEAFATLLEELNFYELTSFIILLQLLISRLMSTI